MAPTASGTPPVRPGPASFGGMVHPPGPVLGLDYGEKRIGMAVSDPDTGLAFPAGTLERRRLAEDLAQLAALVELRGVAEIVVGLPLHLDGRAGEAAEAARRFADRLSGAVSVPVEMFDERLTSVEAERALREAPRGRRRRKGAVDTLAATILLRTYLEQRDAVGRVSA